MLEKGHIKLTYNNINQENELKNFLEYWILLFVCF